MRVQKEKRGKKSEKSARGRKTKMGKPVGRGMF